MRPCFGKLFFKENRFFQFLARLMIKDALCPAGMLFWANEALGTVFHRCHYPELVPKTLSPYVGHYLVVT